MQDELRNTDVKALIQWVCYTKSKHTSLSNSFHPNPVNSALQCSFTGEPNSCSVTRL